MTHMQASPGQNPYEKCEIQFQLPNAIIWQIKFILSSLASKKSVPYATTEFNLVSVLKDLLMFFVALRTIRQRF